MRMLPGLISAVLLVSGLPIGSGAIFGQEPTTQSESEPIYVGGNGVMPASLVQAVPAVLPDEPGLKRSKHISALVIVVGSDGKIKNVLEANKVTSAFDHAAVIATEQSQFQPGSLDGKPVSTRIMIFVPFLGDGTPALPIVPALGQKTGPLRTLAPPVPKYQPEADPSEEARRTRTGDTVTMQILIDDDGATHPLALLKSAGKGLDLAALGAVSRYKFKPATLEGIRVASLILIDYKFSWGPK